MLPATECILNAELTVALSILSAEIIAPLSQPVDMDALVEAKAALDRCADVIRADMHPVPIAPPVLTHIPSDAYCLYRWTGSTRRDREIICVGFHRISLEHMAHDMTMMDKTGAWKFDLLKVPVWGGGEVVR